MIALWLVASLTIAPQQPQKPQAAPQQAPAQAEAGIGPAEPGDQVTGYLASAPDSMHLTPAQRGRLVKVREWLRSQNAPLRDSVRAVTGGRAFRTIPPAERRQLQPRLAPLMERMRANDAAALDSVDAVLTPQQQARLRELRAEYRSHHPRTPPAPPARGGRHS